MARLISATDVLFPVEECPVVAIRHTKDGEQRFPAPSKKALINSESGAVLGIVGRDYRLVTNAQALAWAYLCSQSAFPETKPAEWQVETVDAPSTGSHCYFDLVHNSAALDFTIVDPKNRPDAYGPFIRVTNSYNGLRALSFDVGFYRKVCKNGLILPDTVVKFKFNHGRQYLKGSDPRFEIDPARLAILKTNLGQAADVLRSVVVQRSEFPQLVCIALSIRPFGAMPARNEHEGRERERLKEGLLLLTQRYADALGENGYAVFNAITDFASNPPTSNLIARERQSLQRLAGSWLVTFSKRCQDADFNIAKYIDKCSIDADQPKKPAGRVARTSAELVDA